MPGDARIPRVQTEDLKPFRVPLPLRSTFGVEPHATDRGGGWLGGVWTCSKRSD